jgi:GNAT superfamily N-acetyltransferase
MVSIDRLQAYFRQIARQQYETVSVPGFTLFFHPSDDLPFFNYALPDGPLVGGLEPALSLLRAEFGRRGRRPRFEFVQEYAPALAPALLAAGFAEEARQQLMVCTPESYHPAPDVPGLAISELDRTSALDEVQPFLTVQRQGFDPRGAQPATAEDARRFLSTLGEGRAYVARWQGVPAGAGMYSAPLDGIAEIAGLATLEPYRRRGIATALSARAVSSALARGAEVVCLAAADARAGRVYERVGFASFATMLAYRDDQ